MQIDRTALKNATGEIHRNIDEFLNYLNNISVPSRETLILQAYRKTIEKTAPWVTELNFIPAEEFAQSASPTFLSGEKLKREEYLERILSNPGEKIEILNEFLSLFPEISTSDRSVLINFMKDLPNKELEEEIRRICELFGS